MLECYSLHFIQKIYHTIVKFRVEKCMKIIRILYFVSNAVIGNKFAKFQCFDKEMWPTACFLHSIKTKYVRNEKKVRTENSV